jgi:hypothetical protein
MTFNPRSFSINRIYRVAFVALIVPLLEIALIANLAAQPTAPLSTQPMRSDLLVAPALRAPIAIHMQPDLIVTDIALEPGATTALVSYCVKNIGKARSSAGQVTIGFGGQWRVAPQAGLGVGSPYAFELVNPTSAIAAGAQECKTKDSTIRLDRKYWDNCVEVTIIADATNTSQESNERNNSAKSSTCNQPRVLFPRSRASDIIIGK